MAWFRPMGADEVAYHQATVLGRDDDHQGQALAYYGSRGETPLVWGGTGGARLGLAGAVTPEAYEAVFGPGGPRDPGTGRRLVGSKRPGFELVVGAHKSVAVLGVVGDTAEMHSILDVETAATVRWLDEWFVARGGRRGRVQTRTATGGLTYAVTRHATSRAGDPSPHDHVLVANVVEMLDTGGGLKALDSAALRDTVEAATMVGRLHSAAWAVELGFAIEPDPGPSGNLRHWRIVGVPTAVCERFSKRSDEIGEHLAEAGYRSYRARSVAARRTRKVKRHTGVDQLLPAWRAELEAAGWPVERLAEQVARTQHRGLAPPLTEAEIDRLAAEVLDLDGDLLVRHKVFTRTHLVADVAPRLYGHHPAELDRVLDRITASRSVVPLIRVAGAREQSYTTTAVLAAEQTIARTVERLADRRSPGVDPDLVAMAVAAKELAMGRALTDGQRAAVDAVCNRSVAVLIGVAGSGKTTALDAATSALEAAGHRVVGTSTSGQAARTLAAEAAVEARTFASLLWRLDHGQLALDHRSVVVIDEAGMADDADLARLVLAVDRAGARLVLVGDHRQLAAVGPGGALHALLERRPELVTTLADNVRQRDPAERAALAQLRDGSAAAAVAWYAKAGRIHTTPSRTETLVAMANAWAADVTSRHDTALLAWRRADVADLNRLARAHWERLGRFHGPDVAVHGGRPYAVGDRVVALAPNPAAQIVTSQQLTITALDPAAIVARTDDGRTVTLTSAGIDVEHLDYGYAITVHRAQGATYDRAHVLAAGGGRELSYVAMSRARDHTTVHAVADSLAQAAEDLRADWGVDRHQRWVTDTALPGREPDPATAMATAPPARQAQARFQALVTQPSPIGSPVHHAEVRLSARRHDLHQLRTGTGRWRHTPEGEAARLLADTRSGLDAAERQQVLQDLTRRQRRAAARSVEQWEAAVAAAERRWLTVGEPRAQELTAAVAAAETYLLRCRTQDVQRRLSLGDEPPGRSIPERSLDRTTAERVAHLELEGPGLELGL